MKKRVEARKEALAKLITTVSEAVQPILRFAKIHAEPFILESLPVRDKNIMCSFIEKVPFLLSELFDRCFENIPSQTKIFSFHRNVIECFNKNKHYKGLEFGRQFQLGRLEGNFIYSIPNDSIRMPDANSFKKMLMQHIMLFQTPIESIATDKGYYSKENEKIALDFGVKAVGIPRPIRKLKNAPDNPISPKYL